MFNLIIRIAAKFLRLIQKNIRISIFIKRLFFLKMRISASYLRLPD